MGPSLIRRRSYFMAYDDNYERDTYGTLAFWLRNDYDHGRFFDREISHHELELARANESFIQAYKGLLDRTETKTEDIGTIIHQAKHITSEFQSLLSWTMERSLNCEIIISTPVSLLDHMIRESEESTKVFDLINSGKHVTPADATIHESSFWLRQMMDHLAYINHYVDASNYELQFQVNAMKQKFERLFLQAHANETMFRKPRNEVTPPLNTYNQMIIKEAKALEAFKLELSDLIEHCAAVTTAPPDLLKHTAREAHHLWRNLEDLVIL